MADKKKTMAVIKSQENITKDIFSMWLEFEKESNVVENAIPGQFISMYSSDGSRLLPRPISICEIDKNSGSLRVVYRVVGKGTDEFSKMKKGEKIPVVGPLGNGFSLKGGKAVLIGGGIGIPPMLELAKQLNCKKQIVLGYKDELFLNEEFEKYGTVTIATEDGSCGTKGNVLDAVKAHNIKGDVIYACGPMPMLRAIKAYALENNIECYISLEEKMACGIGACLACVCKSKDIDDHSKVHNKRVCKEGPVFNAKEVEI